MMKPMKYGTNWIIHWEDRAPFLKVSHGSSHPALNSNIDPTPEMKHVRRKEDMQITLIKRGTIYPINMYEMYNCRPRKFQHPHTLYLPSFLQPHHNNTASFLLHFSRSRQNKPQKLAGSLGCCGGYVRR